MKKKIAVLFVICIVMFIFSFLIATVSLNRIVKNNKKVKTTTVNSNKVINLNKVKENEKVHIKSININSIYSKDDDKDQITEKDVLVKELNLKDNKGKKLILVGKNKKELKNAQVIYGDKVYSVDIEDSNNLVFTNMNFQKKYILKFDSNNIAIYEADKAGKLTKIKDTKYKMQDLKLKELDKKLFEKNKIQVDNIENVEDALSEFKS